MTIPLLLGTTEAVNIRNRTEGMSPRNDNLNVTEIAEAKFQEFATRLRGGIIRSKDDEYEEARKVLYAQFDRRPAVIVRCAGVADVLRAIEFARTHDLVVAVRSGAHSAAGYGACDGGMVIDLGALRGVRVDPVARMATAQGGALWRDLDHETAAFGLAVTGGQISSTGIGGLTLGGGLGWLMRNFGLTVDSLLSVDIATADGQFLTSSAESDVDLFWGIRGGGGNFGIVTEFRYQLHPLSTVLAGIVIHPGNQAREVLHFYQEYSANAPDEVTVMVLFRPAPPVSLVPAGFHGKPVVAFAVCYSGPLTEGERVLKRLRTFGHPIVDLIRPMPYVEIQRMFDEGSRPGFKQHARSEFLKDLDKEAVEVIAEHAAARPSQLSRVLFTNMGGAVSRVGTDETAFSHRAAPHVIEIISKWTDAEDPGPHVAWVEGFWKALRPHSTGGVYSNFLGDEGEERVKEAYSPTAYSRLVALKRKYDPTNFFRLNQNIKPDGM